MQRKRRGAEFIQALDLVWAREIQIARAPYPEARAPVSKGGQSELPAWIQTWYEALRNFQFVDRYGAILDPFLVHPLLARAEVDLLETALRLRLNSVDTLAALAGADTKSYWHDPFSERTLLVDDPTSPTLVWSVGPDAKNDNAEIRYASPTAGIATGDIVLDLSRLKK